MRYPAEQKAETHERILATASRSFRERGSDGLGLAPLMKELGITVGGFYRHFGSKEDLYAQAVTRALEETAEWMVAEAKKAPKGRPLRAIIENYLSPKHLYSVGNGCAIAALAPEIGRQPAAIRERVNAAVDAFMQRLLSFFPGATEAERRRQFFLLIPAMAGTLMLARAINDASTQKEVLRSARSFYIEAFGEKKPN